MNDVPFQIAAATLIVALVRCATALIRSGEAIYAFRGRRAVVVALMMLTLSGVFICTLDLERSLYGLALGAGIIVSLVSPLTALSLFVVHLLIRPWELVAEPGALLLVPRVLAAVAVLSWLLRLISSRDPVIVWNRGCALFCGFIVWLMLSALVTQGDASVGPVFAQLFPVIVLTFLLLNVVTRAGDLRHITEMLVIAVTGTVLIAGYVSLGGEDSVNARLHGLGMWSNSNDLAALIVLAAPFALSRIKSFRTAIAGQLLWSITVLVLLIGLGWTQSRGGLAALAACAVVYLGLRRRATAAVLVGGLICISLLLALLSPMLERSADDLALSQEARFNYLLAAVRMAKDFPLFGIGFGNYPHYYERYSSVFHEWGERTAHSTWALALAETGVVGFMLLAALFALVFSRAWKIRIELPELLIALTSYGVAMSFLSHTYLITPYLIAAIVLAGYRISHLGAACKGTAGAAACVIMVAMALSPVSAQAAVILQGAAGSDKPIAGNSPAFTGQKMILKGSRGEVLNFQLQLRGSGCEHILSHEFLGASQRKAAFAVTLYKMPPVVTKQPSYPGAFVGEHFDPLLRIGDELVCLDKNRRATPIWGEIEIPREAEAGTYSASISFGENARLPVELTVWRMQMPEEPALPVYAELTTWFNLLGHFGKWQEGEAALAAAYTTSMRNHRIFPLKSAIAYPEIERSGGELRLNLRSKPDPTSAFKAVVLNDKPQWAYFDFPATHLAKMNKAERADYLSALENSLPDLDAPGKALLYLWDEPKKDDFPALISLAKEVRQYAPSVKIMVTVPYYKELAPYIDIFVPVMDYVDADGFAGKKEYDQIKRNGQEVWWYVSCMSHGCEALADSGAPDFVIDRPSIYIRSIPWIASQSGASAFLYYSVNNGYQFYPKRDPWESLWDFSGNGDGTLFYPGRPNEHGFTRHEPVPSIRMKVWREASFDAEYLRWLKSSAAQTPNELKETVAALVKSPREWVKDYSRYQNLRDRIGEYLNAQEAV